MSGRKGLAIGGVRCYSPERGQAKGGMVFHSVMKVAIGERVVKFSKSVNVNWSNGLFLMNGLVE